jgi:hypothetical protein
MALLIPFAVGLFALTLQGGLLISDQINLQHYAQAGALYAEHNLGGVTITGGATGAGTLGDHVRDDICGGAGTRYCLNGSLAVSVSAAAQPTSMLAGPRLSGVAGIGTGCQRWSLAATAPAPVAQGSTAAIAVSLSVGGGGTTPVVGLSVSGVPAGVSGVPLFTPPSLTGAGGTTLAITPTTQTPPGTYTLEVGGLDQCGIGPSTGPASVDLTVTGVAPVAACSGGPTVFTPAPNAIAAGAGTTLSIPGSGFSGTPTVTFTDLGVPPYTATVNSASASLLSVTVPAMNAGVYALTVTNPTAGSCPAVLGSALVVGGTNAAPPAPGAGTPCAGASPQRLTITVSWNEDLVIPWLTPTIGLNATEVAFCR